MIERARLPRRRKKNPARYYALTALQWVIVFALVFYYAVIGSRSPKVRIEYASVEGNRALFSEPLLSFVRAPLDVKLAHFIRRDNQLLYPDDSVRAAVIASNPRIEDASVSVKSKSITLTIKERVPVYRYCVPAYTGTSSITALTLPSRAVPALPELKRGEEKGGSLGLPELNASTTVIDLNAAGLAPLVPPAIGLGVDIGTHSCYWVDNVGLLFARAPEYSGSPLLTFIEGNTSTFEGSASSTPSPIGTIVLSDDVRAYGELLRDELARAQVVVYDYELLPAGDIRVHSELPYPFIVSMRKTPATEVTMLETALAQFEKNQSDIPKEYLDLRFKEKIFYQ